MTDPKLLYRVRRAAACAKLFEGFVPDLNGSRQPHNVLEACRLAAQGFYSYEIAERLQISPKAVQKIFRRYSFPCLYNFEPPRQTERNDWKTGTKITNGYLARRAPGHPYGRGKGSYVLEHRLVVERKLGRYLQPGEVVDHIDGNRLNNDPDNLRVFQSNGDHLRVTLTGRKKNFSPEGRRRIAEAVALSNRRRAIRRASASQQE